MGSLFGSSLDQQQRRLPGGAYLTEGWTFQVPREAREDTVAAYVDVQVARSPDVDISFDVLVHEHGREHGKADKHLLCAPDRQI